MPVALPLTGNPVLLGRLAGLYLCLFCVLLAAFYLSAYQAGYNTHLALLSCTVAAIECVLLRFKEKSASGTTAASTPVWSKAGVRRSLLSLDQLLRQIDQLRHASKAEGQIGLALICSSVAEPEVLDPRVVTFVREFLFREAHSRLFEVSSDTLAICELDPDIAARLTGLSANLQSEFRTLRQTTPALERHRLTVGVAIATDGKPTAAELLAKAKSATKLALELKRDTFMRQA